MKEWTIKATKNNDEITFTIGKTYFTSDNTYVTYIIELIDITEKQLIFRSVLSGKIYKSPKRQFDQRTANAYAVEDSSSSATCQHIIKSLFEHGIKWFKTYVI